jgi:DNA anti-recombination protein RmuC
VDEEVNVKEEAVGVAEDVRKIGAIMEQLGARFDLVLEAVTGFGSRLDALRQEMVGQFTEVGRQIRFLSDRIAENRDAIAGARADLGAEMVRIGEHLGGTRVHFREEFANVRGELQRETAAEAERSREFVAAQITRSMAELRAELSREISEANESLRIELAAVRGDLGRELPAAAADINSGITASAGTMVKKFDAELKQTNKALTSLARKFERFDDRITVQTKDQDQRLRKLERRA